MTCKELISINIYTCIDNINLLLHFAYISIIYDPFLNSVCEYIEIKFNGKNMIYIF
jgi:hypothetical protein